MNKAYVILFVVLFLACSYGAGFYHAGQRYTNMANEQIGRNNLSLAKKLGQEEIGVLNNILSTLKDGDETETVQYINDAIAGRERKLQRLSNLQSGNGHVVHNPNCGCRNVNSNR